jgi:1,4-dihydroxy-2-naphthoate octaprenyltransferase
MIVRAERKLMSSANAPIKLLKMIRVHIVVGGFLAFLLGGVLAVVEGGSFDPARFVLGYTVMLLGDLSTHYSNDYFDVEVDRYIEQKKFFAGSNILVSNPNLRSIARVISVALLVASNLLAVGLVIFLDAPIEIFIVILGASLAGWFYSAPPPRLISRGVGEAALACVTGFAIPALGYLAVRGQFDPLFIYLAVPFVMYGFMLSLSLGVPDAEVDRKGGKRTLAVRRGANNVFFLILALAVTATLSFIVYRWLVTSAVVDLGVLAVFSIVPLLAGLAGFAGVVRKRSVKLFSGLNVVSLFAFNMLMIAYLAMLIVA